MYTTLSSTQTNKDIYRSQFTNGTRQIPPLTLQNSARVAATNNSDQFTFGSFISSVRDAYQSISGINNFFSNQRAQARLEGQSIFGSAVNFADTVQNYYQMFNSLSSNHSLEGIGQTAQGFVLESLQSELRDAVTQQIGSAAESLGVKELGQEALDFFLGGSSTTAAAEGSSLALGGTTSAAGEIGSGATTAVKGFGAGASKVLGAAGAAYGAYSLIKDWGKSTPAQGAINGATVGAFVGSVIPGVGTLIGGAIGGVVGGLIGCIKSGKHKDQVARDQMRKQLEQIGFINDKSQVTLADGSAYDVGKDGGFKLENVDGTKRRAYEVDFKNPLAGEVVALLSPLGNLLYPNSEKLRNDLVSYLTNASLSNATNPEGALANVQALYKKLGVPPEKFAQALTGMAQQGMFDKQTYDVYLNSLAKVFA